MTILISMPKSRSRASEKPAKKILDVRLLTAAITTAAAILKKEINPKTHAELIDDCIEEIE